MVRTFLFFIVCLCVSIDAKEFLSPDEQERLYREAVREIEISKRAASNKNIVTILKNLETGEQWGEAVFKDGKVREIRVKEVSKDSVIVVEIYGALQKKHVSYNIMDFESIRVLGKQRIQIRSTQLNVPKSKVFALGSEIIIPGTGYLYLGDKQQALSLFTFTGVALTTALLTGEDATPGWFPLLSWVKLASLFQLNDKINAINNNSIELDADVYTQSNGSGIIAKIRVPLNL